MIAARAAVIAAVSIALIVLGLGAPGTARAETTPEVKATPEQVTTAGDAEGCSANGAAVQGDRDCVVLQIEGVPGQAVGGAITLTGRIDADVRQAPAYSQGQATVIIRRAKDGGRWTDKGLRWRKVAKVTPDDRGRFSVEMTLNNPGLYTYHATIVSPTQPTTRDRQRLVSDSVEATAGVPAVPWVFKNSSSHDLDIDLTGLSDEANASLGKMDFSVGTQVAGITVGAPASVALGFTLYQKNPMFWTDPSVYNFVADSNESQPCSKVDTDQLPTVKPGQSMRVEIRNAGFWGLGYTGTITWPDDSFCTFRMLTKTQEWAASQPTWAKAVAIAVGVIASCIAIYYGGAALAGAAATGGKAALFGIATTGAGIAVGAYAKDLLDDITMSKDVTGNWEVSQTSIDKAIAKLGDEVQVKSKVIDSGPALLPQ